MLNEHLTHLWTNIHRTEHCSVRLTESLTLNKKDSRLFRNSFFVFCSILSEKAQATLDESSYLPFQGRILQFASVVLEDRKGVSPFLTLLDEVNDIVLSNISSVSSHLKNETLFDELRCFLSNDHYGFWRLVSPLVLSLCKDTLSVETIRFFHQLSSILSKISVDRSDLLEGHISEYLYSEDVLSAEAICQRYRDPVYQDLVSDIRHVLKPIIDNFVIDLKLVKHGPGAVSDPTVKNTYSKYCSMASDRRVDYLIRKNCGMSLSDFSPFPLLVGQDRSSRVIYVPKTWKKLRGISAEPACLMYFQQAVFRSIEVSMKTVGYDRFVNLRDQGRSRKLALEGSRFNDLSTIDLSSASDSVTLQLVKDVFGSSSLLRWLLATRSTHTIIDGKSIELNKFAPMGSACCFPVECLIFSAVALLTARRSRLSPGRTSKICVFGDDIICPASISSDLIENLTLLGFSVNARKTFTSGDFRESCGMDAWRGRDITPLKLRDLSLDLNGDNPCSYEDFSKVVSYINSLYSRGYIQTRNFLLRKFRDCRVGNFSVSQLLQYSLDIEGTIHSVEPFNGSSELKFDCNLFRCYYLTYGWRPSGSNHRHTYDDEWLYHEYLLKNSGISSGPVSYDLSFFCSALSRGAVALDKPVMKPKKVRWYKPFENEIGSLTRFNNTLYCSGNSSSS